MTAAGSRPPTAKSGQGNQAQDVTGRLLLRVREATDLCGMPVSTGYSLVASGEWPSVHCGRAIRVPVAGLLRWIEERTEA